MVTENFTVSSVERMNKVKNFIRLNIQTARFVYNPYEISSGKYQFCISYEIDDLNKLSKLLSEFNDEDNIVPEKVGFIRRLINYLT